MVARGRVLPAPCTCQCGLRRAQARVLPTRADRGAEDCRAGRSQARRPARFMGRGIRRRSSCPAPIAGLRSISTRTGVATSSIRCPMRWPRRRISCARPAGAGESWGYEVRVPANYRGPSGRTPGRPFRAMANSVSQGSMGAAHGKRPRRSHLAERSEGTGISGFRQFRGALLYNNAESTRLPSRICPTGSKEARRWRPPGRPMIPACRAVSAARFRSCSSPGATILARPMADRPGDHQAIKQVQQELGMKPNGRPSSTL